MNPTGLGGWRGFSASWGSIKTQPRDTHPHHPAVPGFGFTKGLVVELLPLVPASSSGRLVGSFLLVDPAELAST